VDAARRELPGRAPPEVVAGLRGNLAPDGGSRRGRGVFARRLLR
jgi:hypothetical protein